MMTIEQLMSPSVIHQIGWAILHFLWQGTAVAGGLGVAFFFMRKSSANARYLAGCVALLIMAALPLITFWAVAQPPTVTPLLIPVSLPAPAGISAATPPANMNTKTSSLPVVPGYLQCKDVLESHLSWVVAGWLTGVLILSLRLLAAWLDAQRIRRLDCRLLGSDWQDRLKSLSSRIGLTRPIQLLESSLARVPMVIGHLRPAVFLPVTALTGLTPQQLEIILVHELAHIRRYDYLANLIQTVIENLLFFNPAVWWVSQKIRIERENACDDIALAVSGDRFAYARTLVRMEELRPTTPARLAVAAAGGSLLDRVRRLLNADAPYAYSTSRSLAGIIMLGVLVVLVVSLQVFTLTSCAKEGKGIQRPKDQFLAHAEDINAKVDRIKIGRSTRDEVVKFFGEPEAYRWGEKVFDQKNLPDRAIMVYPGDFHVVLFNNRVWEIRFEGPSVFVFRDKIKVGTSLDEVIKVLGPPRKTVDGQVEHRKNEYGETNPVLEDGILYKNMDGRPGLSYYARPEFGVRMFFVDGKVKSLYLTGVTPKVNLSPASTVDSSGRIVDKIDYPFVNDPALIGSWKSVDFVREIDDFNPAQPQWKDLFLKELVFLPEGKTFRPWWTWTKGMIFHSGDHTAGGYTLKDINGSTYMFFEWKSGDYVIRHQKPMYYVLKKVSSEVSKKDQAWAKASTVDLNFRRLAIGKIPKLDINRATLKDVIQLFGKPAVYAWGNETFEENKLPDIYILGYPDHFDIFLNKGKIVELRYYNPGYKYKSIEVGSSLEQVLEVLGPPTKTLTAQKNEFKDGILYKNVDGRTGYHYYARKDKGVRMFFTDNKVKALYVTSRNF